MSVKKTSKRKRPRKLNSVEPAKRWTPEDEEDLKRLVQSGASKAELALATGRSVASISGRAKLLGLKLPRKPYKRARPWSQEEEGLLRKMCGMDVTRRDIAEKLGRTEYKIKLKCRELKLPWWKVQI